MLPQLEPMLAVSAAPFDAPEYSFEIKWDGIRALAAVEPTAWRLWGRERADYTARYPELGVLGCLPAGTLVDGELVAFDAVVDRLLVSYACLSAPGASWTGVGPLVPLPITTP